MGKKQGERMRNHEGERGRRSQRKMKRKEKTQGEEESRLMKQEDIGEEDKWMRGGSKQS